MKLIQHDYLVFILGKCIMKLCIETGLISHDYDKKTFLFNHSSTAEFLVA